MRIKLCALALLALSIPAFAAEPSFKVGGTIFADYSWQDAPVVTDANGNTIHPGAFNVGRAYLNVTGSLNDRIAFRITPDISRESGSGSSLSGSQQFRLKYAFAQLNLDGWTTSGSFVRAGMQPTPFLDHVEPIYRYRFQGTSFTEREGYLTSSDTGLSVRYVFPSAYGDVHAGIYNGEGYAKAEVNDQKAMQVRVTLRPLPKSPLFKGLRTTVFYDSDHYVRESTRERVIAQVTYEHARGNAGLDVMATKDRVIASAAEVAGRGWSVFATPKFGHGFEVLLRHDHSRPDEDRGATRKRTITGIAYWVPGLQKMNAAVLLDRDALSVTGKPDETRFGVKMLLSF
jgi:hypothetical protein